MAAIVDLSLFIYNNSLSCVVVGGRLVIVGGIWGLWVGMGPGDLGLEIGVLWGSLWGGLDLGF